MADSDGPSAKRLKLSRMTLSCLPAELVFSILSYCHLPTILEFRLSSRLHNQIFWTYPVAGANKHTPPIVLVCRALILMRRAMHSTLKMEMDKTNKLLTLVIKTAFQDESGAGADSSPPPPPPPPTFGPGWWRQQELDRVLCGQALTNVVAEKFRRRSETFKLGLDAKRAKIACLRRVVLWIMTDSALRELGLPSQHRMLEFVRDSVRMQSITHNQMDFRKDTEMSYVLAERVEVRATQHTEEGENYSLEVSVRSINKDLGFNSQLLLLWSDAGRDKINVTLLDKIMTELFESESVGLEFLSEGAILGFLLKLFPEEVYAGAESGPNLVGFWEAEIENLGVQAGEMRY